jgi:hypothetical protein
MDALFRNMKIISKIMKISCAGVPGWCRDNEKGRKLLH